jgi:hypothetical protein
LRNGAVGGGRRFRWLLVTGVALLLVLSGIAAATAASKIHVLGEQQLSERMVDVTVWFPRAARTYHRAVALADALS